MFKYLSLTLLLIPGLALATSQPAQTSDIDDSDLEYKEIALQQSDETYPMSRSYATEELRAHRKSDQNEDDSDTEEYIQDVDEITTLQDVQDRLNAIMARPNFAELAEIVHRQGDLLTPGRLAEKSRRLLAGKAKFLQFDINELLDRFLEEPGPNQHELFRKILLLFARSHMLQWLYPNFINNLSKQEYMTPQKLKALAEVFAGWRPTLMHWQINLQENSGGLFYTGGIPLFNFYFDHNNLQHSQLFLLYPGDTTVYRICPGVIRFQHHTFDCEVDHAEINNERTFTQHPIARFKKFARMLQLTKQNVEQRLIPALSPIIMQYAAFSLPAETINGILAMAVPEEVAALEDIEHLGTMQKQLAIEEKIMQLPPKCQQRIAQLYCGSKQCAQALIEKNEQARKNFFI